MGSACALRLGAGVFLDSRKVPGPVCVPSHLLSVKRFKMWFYFIGKLIKKPPVNREGCFFLSWCCVLCEGIGACVRRVCVLPLRQSRSGSLIPFNL